MIKKASWESIEGSSYPLGLNYISEENAYNFAIYSRHATDVSIMFFSEKDYIVPVYRFDFDSRINKSNRIWHCRIKASQIQTAKYYAYKIDGPAPKNQFEWHAFDNDKILLDPYAKAVFFPPGFDKQAACIPGPNVGKAPLGVILTQSDDFDWQSDKYIHHEHELIIYELHVKGFTFHPSSGVPEALKGTFAGVIDKIPYLKELGITAVELMPVHQFSNGEDEYWGYNTLNFFCPHQKYSSRDEPLAQVNEFQTMVRELHKEGIEVILDVVYNHTGEGGQNGPVFSYKGIDNSTYYLINEDLREPYNNYSGTGNTLHTRNSSVRRLILDSLHYWRKEMHIDGFRFDLASVFNRNADGSISFEEPAVLSMINSDPDLATARFIAEPWDAKGAFYLGKKFPGVKWMQWNSFYRDDIRRFVKSDLGMVESLKNRIYGSSDIFPEDLEHAFHAYQSINYITCHDGFTLYDLVAYNNKHNEANGENNTDGAYVNYSWNCGQEGDDDVNDEVMALRLQQAKNFCCILLLSNGTPMFAAGDEFLRTQKGNNNPYNQDNEISWLNWELKEKNADFFRFFKNIISFRKTHPSFSRSRFWRDDAEYFGASDFSVYDTLPILAIFLSGLTENDDDVYIMINAHWEEHFFKFHKLGPWGRKINTALPSPYDFLEQTADMEEEAYLVKPRSICVFVKRRNIDGNPR